MAIIPKSALMVFALVVLCAAGMSQNQSDATGVLREPGGTLEKAAKSRRIYVESRSNLDGQLDFNDIKSILRSSSVVLLGTPTENRCALTDDARDLRTVYTFTIERAFKGKMQSGETIQVALPGGRYTFPDGSTAQINTPNYKRMLNGHRYLLFLSGIPSEHWFSPTGGSQGIFEFREDNKVQPYSHLGFKQLKDYRQDDLLDEVHQSAQSEINDSKH